MSKLSPEQIAQYAHDAGFRGQDLTTAVAVALAESSGRPQAHNATPPDDSYGLWQVNMLGALGPERRRQFDLDSNRELLDPETNAEAAFAISGKGESFRPWTTYTSGAYKSHLDEARRGVQAMRRGDEKGGDEKDTRRPGNGDPSGGFLVDPDALTDYAKRARTIADELAAMRTKELHKVRSLADDSFGRIGKETGFADALNRFGESLQRQVRGVRHNVDTLAGSVARTAKHYREQEADIADDLLQLLRDK
ncbi:transglycosylase SLT domain-containing protein [Actinophytocola sp.]|uniref:transglycosylase SLT domain-containing protein n=1 Tax=Actinophytocola sp. TaxID=1872138 RepID=UPI0025BBED30|nr:transglycosylase SLT domain-containing protein [Actinophytocola sp.]